MLRKLKKIKQLGIFESFKVLHNRCYSKIGERYLRYKVRTKKIASSWSTIAQKHDRTLNFESFFQELCNKPVEHFDSIAHVFSNQDRVSEADAIKNNCFDLLGSGKQCFSSIPWHSDFRLRAQSDNSDSEFDSSLFYKDMQIKSGIDDYVKDIKVPWELSRCQHFFVLGCAYRYTHDSCYAQTFFEHCSDWIASNPLLCGPNWACPMDVAIRALNWIWGFYFFKNAKTIPIEFWQKFVCSLYDHMLFLENNWEIYDSRTSNHYLSDLVGYFYLCYFFSSLPGIDQKMRWCFQEIQQEAKKQIFQEGFSYEGSTAYHQLVTELFYHAHIIAQELCLEIPQEFLTTLQKMFTVLDSCTTQSGTLIKIGDDDSGKILWPGLWKELIDAHAIKENSELYSTTPENPMFLKLGMKASRTLRSFSEVGYGYEEFRSIQRLLSRCALHYYKEFGLSIIKTNSTHIALRHHSYQSRQPSGHFHNDIGSITLSHNGNDIFIDPGSFVYTPSIYWRNYFRSVSVHNTFFIEGHEPIPLNDQLFFLDVPQKAVEYDHEAQNGYFKITTWHDVYKRLGLRAWRVVEFDQDQSLLTITDWWQPLVDIKKCTYTSGWNFTVHPSVSVKTDNGLINLTLGKNNYIIDSEIAFSIIDGYYSPSYGKKEACSRLTASMPLQFNKKIIIAIKLL